MHTSSLCVAAVALLSLAVAEPERPKYYFPRQVKRQIVNNNSDPRTTFARSSLLTIPQDASSSSSKRQVSNPADDSASGIFPSSGATGTGGSLATVLPPLSVDPSSGTVLTVSMTSTVIVVDTGSTISPAAAQSMTDSSVGTSDTSTTFGPNGVVTTPGSAPSGPPAATSSDNLGVFPLIGSVLSAVPTSVPLVDHSTTSTSSSTPDPAAATTSPNASPAGSAPTGLTTTSTSAQGPVASIVGNLLPTTPSTDATSTSTDVAASASTDATSTATDAAASSSTDRGNLLSTVLSILTDPSVPTTTSAPAPVDTSIPSSPSTSTGGNLLSTVLSILTGPSAPATTSSSVPADTTTDTPTPTGSSAPTITGVINSLTSNIGSIVTTPTTTLGGGDPTVVTPTSTNPGTAVVTSTPAAPTTTDTGTVITAPLGNATAALPPTTGESTASTDLGVFRPTTAPALANVTASTVPPDVLVSPTAAQTTPVETPGATTSISPIGTGSDSAWLPTTIAVQAAPTQSDYTLTATTATAIPTSLPQVITPPQGTPVDIPPDSTMVQVGFGYPLNYQFVATNPTSPAQICMYLPEGIQEGLNLTPDEVLVHSIIPYDTQKTLGYVTTLVLLVIPSNMVDSLKAGLTQPLSPIYQHNDTSVAQMMSYINPAIPLMPGGAAPGGGGDSTGTGTGAAPSDSSTPGSNGVFDPNAQNASPTSKSTAAGIAVGAISAAAAYGAAMFFIARRYKKRRGTHRRSSSIQNPSEMRYTGSPALMGGALVGGSYDVDGRESRGSGRSNGHSARTAQISAPMMAENSLGWN